MKKLFVVGVLVAMVGLSATRAEAANFSFTGNFTADDNVQLFNFSVGVSSTVTLRTWSYAGGVNAAGNTIARGGFDPILALFNATTGALINENDDGSGVPVDPPTGVAYDTLLSSLLGPGNYTVAVMEYDNFASGSNLSNGFSRSGQGNFTASFGCPNTTSFADVSGSSPGCHRDNHWAFDILNVASAVVVPPTTGVPEPASLVLLGSGLAAAARQWRKRQAR